MDKIYFEAQTGTIRDSCKPAYSNYYNYVLSESRRADLERAVEKAKIGVGGLEYEPEFIRNLEVWESEDNRGARCSVCQSPVIRNQTTGIWWHAWLTSNRECIQGMNELNGVDMLAGGGE